MPSLDGNVRRRGRGMLTRKPQHQAVGGGATGSRWRGAGLALLSLLVSGDGLAQVPPSAPTPGFFVGNEPISPVPQPPLADPLKIALGEHLFTDPRLSRSGRISCNSCHDIHSNGASDHKVETVPDGAAVTFNTPTVFNAALNYRLNWEGNIRTLEDQAGGALTDRRGMAMSIDAGIRALAQEKGIDQQFEAAYGHGPDRQSLIDAIAAYERSLLTPDSPFDHWLRGDGGALSKEAVEGYHLFKSFGCVACHQGVNVGGNLIEQSGIFNNPAAGRPVMLRVPSLRNVAATAPYFHDGGAPTLSVAVRKMGYVQLDRVLSDEQIKAITAFLDSLTGVYHGRPLTAPR
jgi:cytochrome c peroxidase